MARIAPTHDFDGYPDGLNKQSFRVGVSVDVSEAYAALLVAKGVAVYAGGFVPAPKASRKKSPDKE